MFCLPFFSGSLLYHAQIDDRDVPATGITCFEYHMKKKLFLLLVIFVPVIIFGNNPVILEKGRDEYHIGKHLYILEDKDGDLTFEDVSSEKFSKNFRKSDREIPNFSYTKSAYWVKFQVESRLPEEKTFLLELDYSHYSKIDFYDLNSDGPKEHKQVGNLFPFSQREIKYRNFVFKLKIKQGEKKTVFLRLQSKFPIQIPLIIWSQNAFIEKINAETYLFGFYFGIFAVMLLYNLFLYFSVREKSYIYYVVYILSYGLMALTQSGFAYQYLWPDSPWWRHHCDLFFSMTGSIAAILFTISFLKTSKYIPSVNKISLFFPYLSCRQELEREV